MLKASSITANHGSLYASRIGLPSRLFIDSDRAKAQEHLGTAAAMVREMEMGIWLKQAESALADATA